MIYFKPAPFELRKAYVEFNNLEENIAEELINDTEFSEPLNQSKYVNDVIENNPASLSIANNFIENPAEIMDLNLLPEDSKETLIKEDPSFLFDLSDPSDNVTKLALSINPHIIKNFPKEMATDSMREFAIKSDPTVIEHLGALSENERNMVARDKRADPDFVLKELLVKRRDVGMSEKTFGLLIDREPNVVLVLNQPSKALINIATQNQKCNDVLREKINSKFNLIEPVKREKIKKAKSR